VTRGASVSSGLVNFRLQRESARRSDDPAVHIAHAFGGTAVSIPQSYRSRPSRGELDTTEIPVQRQVPPAPRQQPASGVPVRSRRGRAWAAGGLALGLVVVGAAGVLAIANASLLASGPVTAGRLVAIAAPPRVVSASGTSPSRAAAVTAAPDAKAGSGPRTSVGDGTWKVGDDVAPGTYTTAGPDGSSCYYARLRNHDGGVGDIIDLEVTNGPASVVIRPTDGYFKTTHCSTWNRIG
jgi:hypothetical protein